MTGVRRKFSVHEARRLYESGMSYRETSLRLNVSASAVRLALTDETTKPKSSDRITSASIFAGDAMEKARLREASAGHLALLHAHHPERFRA